MGKTNKEWHAANRMAKNATEEQRLAWHLEHAAHFACRAIPASIRKLMLERGIADPTPATKETQ